MHGIVEQLRRQAITHSQRAAKMWFQAYCISGLVTNDTSSWFFILSLNTRAIDECSKALNTLSFLDRLEK